MATILRLDEIDDLDLAQQSVGSSRYILSFKEIKTNMDYEIEIEAEDLFEQLQQCGITNKSKDVKDE